MVGIVTGSGLGLINTSSTVLGQKGLFGDASFGRTGTRVYINAATGNLIVQDRDALLAATGNDLAGLRTYNSNGSFNDDNGDNWINGFVRQSLRVTAGTWGAAGSTVELTDSDGSIRLYSWVAASNRYVSTTGAGNDTYLYATAGSNVATFSDGDQTATFDVVSGRLQSLSSKTLSNAIFQYDANGNLASVSADALGSGGRLVYEYSGNQLLRLRAVDAQGAILSSTSYAYDARGRLSQVTLDLTPADGQTSDGKTYVTTYSYVSAPDVTNGMLRSISTSDGNSLTFAWTIVGGKVQISSSWGPDGQATNYAYGFGQQYVVTTPGGFAFDVQWDANGIRQSHFSKGANQGLTDDSTRILFEYNANGDLATSTDARARLTNYWYDADNNLSLIRDAAGNDVRRIYADRLMITESLYSVGDPDGTGPLTASAPLTTRYVYNADRQLRFVVTPEGRVTEYRYTGLQRTAAISYLGGVYNVGGLTVNQAPTEAQMNTWVASADKTRTSRTDVVYDLRGEKQRETSYAAVDANGVGLLDGKQHVVNYVYDGLGQLLMMTDGSAAPVTYSYDGLGRVLTRQQGAQFTSYVYQDSGNGTLGLVSTVTEQDGTATVSSYDRDGRLVSVAQSRSGQPLGTTTYTYNIRGQLAKTQDPTGVLHWYLYDERGRKSAEVDGNGTVTEYVYSTADELQRTIVYATPLSLVTPGAQQNLAWADPPALPTIAAIRPVSSPKDNAVWTLSGKTRDVMKSIDAAGYVTEYRRDGAGRLVSTVRYANPVDLNQVAADIAAKKAAAVIGVPVADSVSDRVERVFYDKDGRVVGQLDAEGFLTETRYDAGGRVSWQTRYAEARPAELRAAGTLDQLRPSAGLAGDQRTRYVYDGQNRVIGEIDAEGFVTEQVYDDRGHVAQRTRYAAPLTSGQIALFDAGTGAWRPATTAGFGGDRTEFWRYNALDQLDQQTDADGTVTTLVYDEVGRIVSTTKAAGTLEVRTQKVRYDSLGRVTGALSARGAALLVDGQTQSQVDAIWAQYGTIYTYDLAGRKTSQIVSDGTSTQRTIFFYNEDGQVTHAINALGEVQENQYDGLGQLVKTIAYGGRLSATTFNALNGGLANTAIRNAVQELLAQRTPGNQAYAKAESVFDYDARGLLKSKMDALGYTSSSVYNAFGQATDTTRQLTAGGTTVAQKLEYDRRGVLVTKTDDFGGLNAITRTRVDAFGRVYEQVDARNVVTKTGYDRLGRVVQTTDGALVDRFTTYDAFSRVVTTTDGNSQTTTYRYDIAVRTVEVTTPENIKSRVSRNRHGEVESATDGAGVTTTYAYTESGELKATTTPLNGVNIGTGTKYDSLGRVAESTDANGTVTKYEYDNLNRITTRTVNPGGLALVTSYVYEDTATGSTVLTTEVDGRQTLKSFDVAGRLVASTVDPSGLALTTRFELDADGRTLKVTDPNNIVTRYEYDKLGRRTAEVTDDGVNAGDLKLTRTYVYDLAGRLASSTDWTGTSRTRYAYDDANRLIYEIDPMGSVRYTEYDGEGRERRVTRLATPLTAANLAALGTQPTRAQVAALVTSVPAKDEVTGRVFDKDGRVKFSVDAAGTVVEFRYDGAGRVKQQIAYATPVADTAAWMDGGAAAPAGSADDRVTSTLYDDLGRATTVVDAEGGITVLAYDAAGNLRQKTAYARVADATKMQALRTAGAGWTAATLGAPLTHAQDRLTNYRYDAAGRLRFEYDAGGYVTETVYQGLKITTIRHATPNVAVDAVPPNSADDRATSVELDKAGRVWKSVDAMGVETRSVYDKGGRLSSQTQAYGLPEATTTGYVYDDAGHVIRKTVAQGTAAESSTRYGYDTFGRMTTEIEARGVALAESTSDWAKGERVRLGKPADLLQLSEPDKLSLLAKYTTTHEYDAAGRRKATINAMGFRTSTEYDAFGNGVKVTDPLGNVGYFYFDKLNRVTMQIDPEGNATRTLYWGAGSNQVAKVRRYFVKVLGATTAQMPDPPTGGKDALTTNVYDRLDRLVSSTMAVDGGSVTESTQYNAGGNRFDKQVRNKVGGTAVFNTDKLGNTVKETLPVTVDGVAVVNSYGFDAFGNRTSAVEAVNPDNRSGWISRATSYKYDKAGRLTHRIGTGYEAFDGASQTTSTVIPVEWTRYDALGRVVEQVSRGNWVGGSQVVGGARSLTRYDAAGNKLEQIAADGAYAAYEYDAAGHAVRESARGTVAVVSGSTWTAPGVNAAIDRNTVMVYDALGRLVEKSRENVRYWEANPNSNEILAPLSTPTTVRLQGIVYDAVGNVVQEIDGRGNSIYSYYDKIGRKVLRIDQESYAVGWDYEGFQDAATTEVKYAGRVAAYAVQTDTQQAASLRNPAQLRAGLSLTDARTTRFVLDTLGRVTEKRVLGVASTYLNASGAAVNVTMDAVSTFEYDGLGNVRKQRDLVGLTPDGTAQVWNETVVQYDSLGRETRRIAPGFTDYQSRWVTPITDTEYNGLGLVSRTTLRGLTTAEDRVSRFDYNGNGDRVGMTDAQDNFTRIEVDAQGQVGRTTAVAAQLALNGTRVDVVKRYAYDAMARVTAEFDGDATHAQSGEIRRTRYNVFGDIVGKGMGDGWQEFAEYNVLGKVERNNSEGGAITVFLYDRNGNATRKIVSADASQDLRNLSIKQAADNLTQLNHTFSAHDARNQLLKTVDFKADYQMSVAGRTGALSQQLMALYGAIDIAKGDGRTIDTGASGGPFPVTAAPGNGIAQAQIQSSASVGAAQTWETTGAARGNNPASAPLQGGLGALLNGYGYQSSSSNLNIPTIDIQMPASAADLVYDIRRYVDESVGTVRPGDVLTIRPQFLSYREEPYSIWATVGGQRILFGTLYVLSQAGEVPGDIEQSWRMTGVNQLVFSEQGDLGKLRITREGNSAELGLQDLGNGIRGLSGLPVGDTAIIVQRFDASGRVIGAVRQVIRVDASGGAWAISSQQLSLPDIAGVARSDGHRLLSFAKSVVDGGGNAEFWVRRSPGGDYQRFSISGGVLDLANIGAFGQDGNFEFIVKAGSSHVYGTYGIAGGGVPSVSGLRTLASPAFPNFSWSLSAPLGSPSPVSDYRATLSVLVNGQWIAVKSGPANGTLSATQDELATALGTGTVNPFETRTASYRIDVVGVKAGGGETAPVTSYSGTLSYGRVAAVSGGSGTRFSNIVSLGTFDGIHGRIVLDREIKLSGAYVATIAGGDASRWEQNGTNLQLGDWIAAGVPGVADISYASDGYSFKGKLTLDNEGRVSVRIDTVTTRESAVTVTLPPDGKLKAGSLSILDANGNSVISTHPIVLNEKGRFAFKVPGSDAGGQRFTFTFEVEDDQATSLMKGDYVYTVGDDGAVSLTSRSTGLQPAYLEFPVQAKTDTLTVRVRAAVPAGQPWGPVISVPADPKLGDTKRRLSLKDYLPSDANPKDYEFLYELGNSTQVLSKGRGSFQLERSGRMALGLVLRDRMPLGPITFLGPSVETATKLNLIVVGGAIVTLNGVWKDGQMTYTWASPMDGAVFESPRTYKFIMQVTDAAGNPVKDVVGERIDNIEGEVTFGTTEDGKGFSFKRLATVVNASAQIRRFQSYNAFGEILEEYDDGIVARAQAMTDLYAAQGLGRFGFDDGALRTQYAYNTLGKLISKTDPDTFETMENGYIRRIKPMSTFGYDLLGRNVIQTDANGHATRVTYAGGSTLVATRFNADETTWRSTDYDVFLDARRQTNELRNVVLQDYDKMGNLLTVSRLDIRRVGQPGVSQTLTESYGYDGLGQRISHKNALGDSDLTYYDSLGRVVQTTSAASAVTKYAYLLVARGAATNPIFGAGSVDMGGYRRTTIGADNRTTIDAIDYFGRTTWHQDLGGNQFTYRYNSAGQLASQSGTTGQEIEYRYMLNGLLTGIVDKKLFTLTQYGYDNTGNRTFEGYGALESDLVTVKDGMKSTQIQYDELNRIARAWDKAKQYDLRYEYDAVGNRRAGLAVYWDPTTGKLNEAKQYWYIYDKMDRFTTTMGRFVGIRGTSETDDRGRIEFSPDGKKVEYDGLGQRTKVTQTDENNAIRVERYTYTADGYLENTYVDNLEQVQAQRTVDAAGRTTMYQAWSGSKLVQTKRTLYTRDNRVRQETVSDQESGNGTTTYDYMNGGFGSLEKTTFVSVGMNGMTQTTNYSYVFRDSALKDKIVSTQSGISRPGTSTFSYDVNGYLIRVTDEIAQTEMTYKTNAQGLILSKDTLTLNKPGDVARVRWYFYADGRRVGDVGNDGKSERVSYVEQLAQLALSSKERAERNKNAKPVTNVDFDQNYEPINSTYPAATSAGYTVRNGDTLSSIAQSLWGDAAMWYMIADVNGLKGGEKLVEGQVLVIPNKLTNIHNNASTFRPYNPGEAIGRVDPTLPPPPAPPQKGCGLVGQFVMVVVAVAVAAWTGGQSLVTLQGLLGTTGGYMASAAVGAAAGSVASQGAGMAMGNVDRFSWNAVGQAALSAAVTAGVLRGAGALAREAAPGSTVQAASEWLAQTEKLAPTVARAVISSAVVQAMQGQWSWREVGASAVSAGAGFLAGEAFGGALKDANGGKYLAAGLATAAGSWASSQVMGYNSAQTRARLTQAFVSGVGQGIGNAMSDAIAEQEQRTRDTYGIRIDNVRLGEARSSARLSAPVDDDLGPASAKGTSSFADYLIARESARVNALTVGAGTLVDRTSIRSFDALAAEFASSRGSNLSALSMFRFGSNRLDYSIGAGGYSSYDKPLPSSQAETLLQLQALNADDVDGVNRTMDAYGSAYASDAARSRLLPSTEIRSFANTWSELNNNQKGYVLAGIVNGTVKSSEYMDQYRAGGYQRDVEAGLEYAPTLFELIDPRTLARGALTLGKVSLAAAESFVGTGRMLMGSLASKVGGAFARFGEGGEFLAGAAAVRGIPGREAHGIPGVPWLSTNTRTWMSGMKLRSNLEVYGVAGARTSSEEGIQALMKRAGYEAEDLAGVKLQILTPQEYEAVVAIRRGGHFDAVFGPQRLTKSTYSFADDIATRAFGGKPGPVTIRLAPETMLSDEKIIQAVVHEMTEIEYASVEMRLPMATDVFRSKISDSVNQNWHFKAIIEGDLAVLRFRESFKK